MSGEIIMRVDVFHDADFDDAAYMPLDGTRPRDLTGKSLELVILPVYDHPTPLRVLSSTGSEIVIDKPLVGGFRFNLPQATLQASLPVGEWVHFLSLVS